MRVMLPRVTLPAPRSPPRPRVARRMDRGHAALCRQSAVSCGEGEMGVCTALCSWLHPYRCTVREGPGCISPLCPNLTSWPKFRHCPQVSPFCFSSFRAPSVSDLACGVLKAEGRVQQNQTPSAVPHLGRGGDVPTAIRIPEHPQGQERYPWAGSCAPLGAL